MDQHAIPQQISSYEFKLVGEMTLKQFMKAGAGVGIALLLNSTKMLFLVKWILMIASVGIAFAFAFVPFEDRPLEHWIKMFFRAIFSPTIFLYQRGKKKAVSSVSLINKTSKVKNSLGSFSGGLKIGSPKGKIISGATMDDVVSTIQNKGEEKVTKEEVSTTTKRSSINEPVTVPPKEELVVKTEDDWRDKKANLNLKTEKLSATGKAVFGEIPMPDIPEIPNLIVGMITDAEGKIIEGAIVEIQDNNGNPSRVLKTNSLGQFKTSTPLSDGQYLIICDKENYSFDRVNVDLSGKIVAPIKIQSRF